VGRNTGSYSLYTVAADGSGSTKPLISASHALTPNTPISWSPQGALVFMDRGDLWVLGPGETEPRVLERTPGHETTPAFSPDGKWLAYASDDAGRFDVYVRPFQNAGEKYVISNSGGSEPVWARSGRELFFKGGDRFMVVDISTTPKFSASRPRLLFTMRTQNTANRTDYDVSPDGQTFVMADSGEDDRAAQQVMLLQNWFNELKRLR
jgi:WD40 repeat protein